MWAFLFLMTQCLYAIPAARSEEVGVHFAGKLLIHFWLSSFKVPA
jgi:hypothetical protein